MEMVKVRVRFLPSGEVVEAEPGSTILELAREAGIPISAVCGGDGICGGCRVIIQEGEVEASPTSLLTRDEIQRGYALACQTRVKGDLQVLIPPEARSEGAQILLDEDAQRFRALLPVDEEGVSYRHQPLVTKVFLKVSKPSLEDNLGDQERLLREIRRRTEGPAIQTGLKVLQGLPGLVRKDDWEVTATLALRGAVRELVEVEPGEHSRNLGVAVDVGTSTVVAHLADLSNSRTVDAEACYNSQARFGEEVTRRIIHAERGGMKELHDSVIDDVNRLISALVSRNAVELKVVTAVVCAGNSAMQHFVLGLDPAKLRKAPYVPVSTSPPPVRAAEVGIKINPRGLLYTVPSIGGWVGGDITAGIVATGLHRSDQLTMLVDIGTNGEIVLGNKEWMLACSTSAGPAFEGSGVQCGLRAGHGAIEQVEISSQGHVHFRVIGGTKPKGICGSGLIDLLAELAKAGVIDRSGQLRENASPRVRNTDGLLEFVVVPGERAAGGKDIVVTQADIENLLRAKAAVYAGADILLSSVGLKLSDVERLLVAGGFGNYLNRENAVLLGLLPDIPMQRIRFVGNTAIMGAKLSMLSAEALHESHEVSRGVTYFDLISYSGYYDDFMSAKFIPHTEEERFPSVSSLLKEATA